MERKEEITWNKEKRKEAKGEKMREYKMGWVKIGHINYVLIFHCHISAFVFLFSSSKANQDCAKLEAAVEMLLELKKRAKDESALNRIVGYPGDLAALGPVLRHVSSEAIDIL